MLLSGAGSRNRSRSRLDQLHNNASTVDLERVDLLEFALPTYTGIVCEIQCCGAGAGGAEIIWDLEPEPKLNF